MPKGLTPKQEAAHRACWEMFLAGYNRIDIIAHMKAEHGWTKTTIRRVQQCIDRSMREAKEFYGIDNEHAVIELERAEMMMRRAAQGDGKQGYVYEKLLGEKAKLLGLYKKDRPDDGPKRHVYGVYPENEDDLADRTRYEVCTVIPTEEYEQAMLAKAYEQAYRLMINTAKRDGIAAALLTPALKQIVEGENGAQDALAAAGFGECCWACGHEHNPRRPGWDEDCRLCGRENYQRPQPHEPCGLCRRTLPERPAHDEPCPTCGRDAPEPITDPARMLPEPPEPIEVVAADVESPTEQAENWKTVLNTENRRDNYTPPGWSY